MRPHRFAWVQRLGPPSRRTASLLLLSLLVAGWSGWSAGWPGPRLLRWQRHLEEQLLRWRGPRQPPTQVVLVPIDDATLQQGAWFADHPRAPAWARGIATLPWPRATYGLLAERLLQAGAEAVAINVVFEGPSGKGPADDAAMLALLTRHRGRIALAAEMLEPSDSQGGAGLVLVRPELYLPALGGPAPLGLTNLLLSDSAALPPHPDAYGRGLLARHGVTAWPSLSTSLLQLAGRRSRQDDLQRSLNPYGPEGSLLRLPAWEVLDPERWRQQPLRHRLAGALVLVGPVTAQAAPGHPTPFGPLSSLELLATATANSLQGDGLAPWPAAPASRALLAAVVVLSAALIALLRPGLRWRLPVLALALLLLLLAAGFALQQHRWLPLLPPAGGLGLLALLHTGDAYRLEGRERRRLRRTFERYVAPTVVAEILADPQAAQGILRGRLLEVTVLFADLQGFTALTRRRSAAGQTELHVRQLNAYLGAMVEVITAHGGTVDKFIGDAVMAVFGSPVGRGPGPEALAALRCARAMGERLQQLNAAWRQQGLEPLASGIGLASGPVLAGQIGSPQRLEFTVIGDTVNRASRLEGLTRSLQAAICLDAATAERVGPQPDLPLQSFGPQRIKGLDAVEVFGLAPVPPAAGQSAGFPS